MWLLSIRSAVAHRSRLVLTVVAVVLGVAFVSGSLVLTDTSQKAFDDQFRTATAGVDLTVRDAAAFDAMMGVEVERDPVPAGVVQSALGVDGVADARGIVQGQGLLEVDGEAVVPAGPSLLVSWAEEPFGAFRLRDGRAPASDSEVVVDSATASQYGVAIGDTVVVRAVESTPLTVVGIAGFGDGEGLADTTVALTTPAEAQRLLSLGDGVTEVRVVAEDGVPAAQLQSRLSSALGSDYDVSASQDVAAASAAAAATKLSYLRVVLLAMAAAALLVGAFLIANTFSVVVAQRTRELALLRAAGATGRQVLGSVLGEALLVGLLGSAIGTVLGFGAAFGLRGLAGAFGVPLPDGALVVEPRTIVLSLLGGVLVTVLAAVGPARRAARVAPVEAMTGSAAVVADRRRSRSLAGAAAAVLAVGGLGGAATAGQAVLAAPATVLAVVALLLLGPVLVPGLARWVGRPLGLAGSPGLLARESVARAPRRATSTAMALALGLALVAFLSVLGESVRSAVAGTYGEVISADLVVESARAEMLGGLSPEVAEVVADVPGVEAVSRLRFGHWKDAGATSALAAVDPSTVSSVMRLSAGSEVLDELADGGVVVAQDVAAARGLSVGDSLAMTFSRNGTVAMPVVGLIDDGDAEALMADYVVSLEEYSRLYREDLDATVFVRVAKGADVGVVRSALEEALAEYPTADVRDQDAAIEARTAAIDQVLGLVTVLLALAVIIALLGVTNTLALSVVERTREIGLLRAVGMTASQLRQMVRGEAVLVAALAVVTGVVLGGGVAVATVTALSRSAEVSVVLPGGRLLAVVAVALLAGLAAGLVPARRAARLDVLTAIATE